MPIPYLKGSRVTNCPWGDLQLRPHPNIRPIITTPSSRLAEFRDNLDHFLVHLPFALCLLTTANRYESLVPQFKRRHNNWAKIILNSQEYQIGQIFASVFVLIRLNRRTVNVFLPTKKLSKSELIHGGLIGLRQFRLIRIGTSTICGIYPLIEAVLNLFDGDLPSRLAILMSTMGAKLLKGQGTGSYFDIQAVAEASGHDLTFFVNEMLKAIDRFL